MVILGYDVDRILGEIQHQMNQAESRFVPREFGRTARAPRRRIAPLNDSYDAATTWVVIGFVIVCLVFTGIGFGQAVLWLERAVRG